MIVNHFKSKGSGVDDGTGQGNANPDRIGQAKALVDFADEFADRARHRDGVPAGDFNSYSMEDPMQVLVRRGLRRPRVRHRGRGDATPSAASSGSLDHVLANAAAVAMVTGADVWHINAAESVAYQYSRYNYNATQFFNAADPFAASDHDPEIVGLDLPEVHDRTIQILGTNDFHGRIANDPGTEAVPR